MRLPTTPATTLWRELRDEVRHHYRAGRVIVAVDGDSEAGTAVFADGLAEVFAEAGTAVFRAGIDGFHRPRAERYARGRTSAEGIYRDSFDYPTFRRVLVDPFRDGAQTAAATGFQLAAFDVVRDSAVESQWVTAPRDAVLVVDGTFLHRPELTDLWDWSVWLEAATPAPARDAQQLPYRASRRSRAERHRPSSTTPTRRTRAASSRTSADGGARHPARRQARRASPATTSSPAPGARSARARSATPARSTRWPPACWCSASRARPGCSPSSSASTRRTRRRSASGPRPTPTTPTVRSIATERMPRDSAPPRRIDAGIAALTGRISQVPEHRVRHQGRRRRAYDLVRAGEEVALAAREVTVSRFDVVGRAPGRAIVDLDVVVDCSSRHVHPRPRARPRRRRSASAATSPRSDAPASARSRSQDAVAVDDLARRRCSHRPSSPPPCSGGSTSPRTRRVTCVTASASRGRRTPERGLRRRRSTRTACSSASSTRRGADLKSVMNMPEEAADDPVVHHRAARRRRRRRTGLRRGWAWRAAGRATCTVGALALVEVLLIVQVVIAIVAPLAGQPARPGASWSSGSTSSRRCSCRSALSPGRSWSAAAGAP